jgi:hypothetical protein
MLGTNLAIWRAKVKVVAATVTADGEFNLASGTPPEGCRTFSTAYSGDMGGTAMTALVPYWLELDADTGVWEYGLGNYSYDMEGPSETLTRAIVIDSSAGYETPLDYGTDLSENDEVTISAAPFPEQNFNGVHAECTDVVCTAHSTGDTALDYGVSGVSFVDYARDEYATNGFDLPLWAHSFRVHVSNLDWGSNTSGTYRTLQVGPGFCSKTWAAADGDETILEWTTPWLRHDQNINTSAVVTVVHDATASIDVSCNIWVEYLIGRYIASV